MKVSRFFIAGMAALMAFVACNKDEEKEEPVVPDPDSETDESYYASQATIGSSDPRFTSTSDGGTIDFTLDGGTVVVDVDCGVEWNATATGHTGWLDISTTSNSLTVSADPIDTYDGNSAIIVLSTAKEGISFATINVSQSGVAYITLSTERLVFANDASYETVTVESNYDWEWSYNESDSWLTIEKGDEGMIVTVDGNTGDDGRETVVTVIAGDSEDNTAEAQLTIKQTGTALILTYSITSAGTSTSLPLGGTINCTVDWGDGSEIETVTKKEPSHTYAEIGDYDIIIKGTVTALYSSNISKNSSPLPLTAVKQWGKTELEEMKYAFNYCKNLVSLPENTGDVFANVTTFQCVFYYATALEEIPKGMFDSDETTTFQSACYGAESLRIIPEGLFDRCAKAENFTSVFQGTAIEDIPEGLFDGCVSATNFKWAFNECASLKAIPAGLFDNCPKVTNFYGVFRNCTTIEEIPAGLFDNCPEVTDLSYIFMGCEGLKTIPAGLFVNNTKNTTFAYSFNKCTGIEEIPAEIFNSSSSVTTFSYCFNGNSALKSVPAGLFSTCRAVTNFNYAFQNCSELTCESPYDEIDGVKVHLYERTNYPDIYATPTSTNTFAGCTGLTDYNDIPSSWGGGGE